MLDFSTAPRQDGETGPTPSGLSGPGKVSSDSNRLYNAPFSKKTRTVFIFSDMADADAYGAKLPEETYIEASCPPQDYRFQLRHFQDLKDVVRVGFFVSEGDINFISFAQEAGKVLLNNRLRDKYGKITGRRTVRIVDCPPAFNFDLDFRTAIHLFEATLNFWPKSEPEAEEEKEDGQEGEHDQDNRQWLSRAIKIKAIKKFRNEQIDHKKTPRTFMDTTGDRPVKRSFVDYWWYAWVLHSKLPNGELAAATIIRSSLMGPWTFECWPGSGRVAKWSDMSKPTWLRNRDKLADRGLVELEPFGNGSAPIIYIIAPDISYRSVFAPSNRAARKKNGGDDE